jgi:hypothetical protein
MPIVDELEQLQKLFIDGFLTEVEYERAKQLVLYSSSGEELATLPRCPPEPRRIGNPNPVADGPLPSHPKAAVEGGEGRRNNPLGLTGFILLSDAQ